MKYLLLTLSFLFFSLSSRAAGYLGANYGLGTFSNEPIEERKVQVKGSSYGAFLGYGRDFVGLEGFYQTFDMSGEIKHDGGTHKLIGSGTAMGAALRFSFDMLYFRLGAARYKLNQSVDIADEDSRRAAEQIYNVPEKDATRNGVLMGGGLHFKLRSIRAFVELSRYQISGMGHYDVIAGGLVLSLPDRMFNAGKN